MMEAVRGEGLRAICVFVCACMSFQKGELLLMWFYDIIDIFQGFHLHIHQVQVRWAAAATLHHKVIPHHRVTILLRAILLLVGTHLVHRYHNNQHPWDILHLLVSTNCSGILLWPVHSFSCIILYNPNISFHTFIHVSFVDKNSHVSHIAVTLH